MATTPGRTTPRGSHRTSRMQHSSCGPITGTIRIFSISRGSSNASASSRPRSETGDDALAEVERRELRRLHLGAELVERPRPGCRNAAVVEIPALASGHPHRLLRRLGALGFELVHCCPSNTDLAVLTRAETLEQLRDVR